MSNFRREGRSGHKSESETGHHWCDRCKFNSRQFKLDYYSSDSNSWKLPWPSGRGSWIKQKGALAQSLFVVAFANYCPLQLFTSDDLNAVGNECNRQHLQFLSHFTPIIPYIHRSSIQSSTPYWTLISWIWKSPAFTPCLRDNFRSKRIRTTQRSSVLPVIEKIRLRTFRLLHLLHYVPKSFPKHPSAGVGNRPQVYSGTAGTQKQQNHRNLYACQQK